MATTATITIQDRSGLKSTTSVNFPSSVTISDAQEGAQKIASLINDLITGVIVGIGVSLDVGLPSGLRTIPEDGADVEEGARFIFNSTGGYNTSVRVPTFNETKIVVGTKVVDLGDVQVAAFTDGMINGVNVFGGGTVQPSDYRGADIVGLSSARESFQSTRR